MFWKYHEGSFGECCCKQEAVQFLCEKLKATRWILEFEEDGWVESQKNIDSDGFTNFSFKAFRGHNHEVHEFSLADIPFLNPYD